jgi:cytidine deaminase
MLNLAKEAFANAYVPFSNYRVGACVEADGKLYTGCNIENASYGLSNCAERTAIFKAVSEGARTITAVAVASPNAGSMPYPCGACRQVVNEFAEPDTPIWITDCESVLETTLAKLLPHSFKLRRADVGRANPGNA